MKNKPQLPFEKTPIIQTDKSSLAWDAIFAFQEHFETVRKLRPGSERENTIRESWKRILTGLYGLIRGLTDHESGETALDVADFFTDILELLNQLTSFERAGLDGGRLSRTITALQRYADPGMVVVEPETPTGVKAGALQAQSSSELEAPPFSHVDDADIPWDLVVDFKLRLECHDGWVLTSIRELESWDRSKLQHYLERRGYMVRAEESTDELRASALEDFKTEALPHLPSLLAFTAEDRA